MADLIRSHAADIIEPRLTGTFKRRERAESIADDLHHAGLLGDGRPAGSVSTVRQSARERVVNNLQCRLSWPDAELIAADLFEVGLLREGA